MDDKMMDNNALPKHIAVIMDGNGRWAKKQGMIRSVGHRSAMSAVKTAINYCSDKGIEVLTLYAFSTENWKRPKEEISVIMNLIIEYLLKETPEVKKKNAVFNFIGDLSKIPRKSLNAIDYAVRETKGNNGLLINIALNYGGRDEIIQAVKQIARAVEKRSVPVDQISSELFSEYLYTKGMPDPDLIIRSGGEKRLSNFLTWQSVYSELYFTDKLWPDFDEHDFDDAIRYYQTKNRRFGGLSEK